MSGLKEYEPIIGTEIADEIRLLADKAKDLSIQNVNSTALGGGVAEILNRMIPLYQEMGVNARWDVIQGDEAFFKVTKKFHNALHGKKEDLTAKDFEVFREAGRKYTRELKLTGNVVFIHDPQPIALIHERKPKDAGWIWRCHVDVSNPDRKVWQFLEEYINRFDVSIFSAPTFAQQLPIPQFLIAPSIDPLSDKNKELPEGVIRRILEKYGLHPDKPIVTQVSRFDYLKDPIGVIDAVEMVQRYVDCQLVLVGGEAADDPEASEVLALTRERAGKNKDIHVLAIPSGSDLEINALQRASSVVVQKSLKEGFGLTVTEALWKGKPVVASAVGGITLQIAHRYSGLLCHSIEGAAHSIKLVLQNPAYGKRLGENGREHVRQNFLLTRHLHDYLLVFLSLRHKNEDTIYF